MSLLPLPTDRSVLNDLLNDPLIGLPPSMRFAADSDVLAMLGVSGGNMGTAGSVLRTLARVAEAQGARVWVQMFDGLLREGIQPATNALLERLDGWTIGGGGTLLTDALKVTIAGLHEQPLPNGRRPDHLVLAFLGNAEAEPAPTLLGQPLPTTLLLPSSMSGVETAGLRQRWSVANVPVVHLHGLEVALEAQMLRETVDATVAGLATAPRARL